MSTTNNSDNNHHTDGQDHLDCSDEVNHVQPQPQQQTQHRPSSSTNARRDPPMSSLAHEERMPSNMLTPPPRRASRPPSLELPASQQHSQIPSSDASVADASVSSFSVSSIPSTINTSRWSRYWNSSQQQQQQDESEEASVTSPQKPSNPYKTSTTSTCDGGKSPSSTSKTAKRVEVHKHRQTKRRWRFRQGIARAGMGLDALEEGEEGDTEQTSRVTEDQLLELDSGNAACCCQCGCTLSCCWDSTPCRWCLIFSLCFVVVALVVAVVIYFVANPFATDDAPATTTVAPPTMAPTMDWSWDPAILDGPPRSVRELLPGFTLMVVDSNPSSPQAHAVAYVENHPDYDDMPNWKKVQLVALVSFYQAFNGKEWPSEKGQNWLETSVDECFWGDPGVPGQYEGVGCHHHGDNHTAMPGRYRHLNLDWFLGFGLVGFPNQVDGNRMPPEVVFLTELESLGLMNCGLSAKLTNLVPPTVLDMPRLHQLSFKFNRIEGTIPDYLGLMTQLEYLSLGNNFLSGTIPPILGKLTRLKEVFLYSNELVGSLPASLAQLTQVTDFSVISNHLTGTIPEGIAQWTKLEFFFADHNPLTGSVPPGVCQLPNITSILLPCSVECGTDCGALCQCY